MILELAISTMSILAGAAALFGAGYRFSHQIPREEPQELTIEERVKRAQGFTVTYGTGTSLGGEGYPGESRWKDNESLKVDGRRSWVGRSRFAPRESLDEVSEDND